MTSIPLPVRLRMKKDGENTRMKKAVVLAGGIAQVALIEELKSRGYRTLLADMNPNCVAAKYCDEF